MEAISDAFDEGMQLARKGAPPPQPGEKRQQIVPFFDYYPEVLYPLLDHEKIVDIFAGLMGEDFILTLREGIIHTGRHSVASRCLRPGRLLPVCGRQSILIRLVPKMDV